MPKSVACAIIERENGEILVVDKTSNNTWEEITILPWWKREGKESYARCLIRELKEELWILIRKTQLKFLWVIHWKWPWWIETKVHLFQLKISDEISKLIQINPEDNAKNPRFCDPTEVFDLIEVTEITQNCIAVYLNKVISPLAK
jgi:8-oxo-dGTP pyrophosphatase MutT (NUDIX family)